MADTKLLFLSDHETSVDLLYYEAISRTIVKFVRQSADQPLTIGVHGDWGAGKSSILKMISSAFQNQDGILTIWFNGWTFEGFDDAKTVVIETLVTELKRARPTSTKVADAAKKVLRRIDWLKVAQKAGGLAFTVTTGIPGPDRSGVFPAPLTPDINEKALEGEGLVAKTAGGPAQGTVTIADRDFGYAALRTANLAADTGVVVLRTEF